jgi:hypothetical protein
MGEYEYRADPARNRVYIRISGFFRDDEVDPLLRELEGILDTVRPGFDVVTDLTGFKPGAAGASEALRRGGELVKARGRRRAVRVTGRLVSGLLQFKRMLRPVFDEEDVRYARSIGEADAILDDWPDDGATS